MAGEYVLLDCTESANFEKPNSMTALNFTALTLSLLMVGVGVPAIGQSSATPLIGYHEPKVDSAGRIVPWFSPLPSQAYDHDIRILWAFWHTMRKCSNGVPLYLQHQVWTPDKDDPRGLGGDQINMALDSWNLLYGYLGDMAVKQNMVEIADYWLEHGIADSRLPWGDLPYPYNTDVHSAKYDGDMRAGKDFLQPDKAGSFGFQLVVLYKMTGQEKYLLAAQKIADRLAHEVNAGDAANSPWPFRVRASDGVVHSEEKDGKATRASYTTNWSPTLRMFMALEQLKRGDAAAYQKAIDLTSAWLKQYPFQTSKWGPFFEDIPTSDYSDTEINADTMAAFVLENSQWDLNSAKDASGMLKWSYDTLQNHEYERWGVIPLNEQTVYRVPGNSHTSRHASVELLYCEKTGDCKTKEDAIRRLNWATYTVDNDGKNRYIRDDVWLTDGYGDYIRHYLRAMASAPELAPEDQNHLLRTSSVIQEISYQPDRITYRKYDRRSSERFKIGQGTPRFSKGATMSWDAAAKLLTVESTEPLVEIGITHGVQK
jgi:hypothetical protein